MPSVLSVLVLRYLGSLLPSSLAPILVSFELFDHDGSLADVTGFGSRAADFLVFLLGIEGDLSLAVLTDDWSFRALLFMRLELLAGELGLAEGTWGFGVELCLRLVKMYLMLLLVIDIDHLVTVFTLFDVSAAVGLVKVDLIDRELLFAVLARLNLSFRFHFE